MKYLFKIRLWKTLLRVGPFSGIIFLVPFAVAFAGLTEVGIPTPNPTSVSTSIPNPLVSKSFPCLIKTLSLAAIQVAVPIAVVAIIIIGVRYILAAVGGKSGEMAKIHTLLFWTLVGTAVVVGSFVLASAAVQLLGGPAPGQPSC